MLPAEAIGGLLSTNNFKKVSKQYSQILGSLPTEWRHLLNTTTDKPDDNFSIRINRNTDPKLVSKLNCKTFYDMLVKDEAKFVYHDYKKKWIDTLGEVNWEKTFKDLQKSNFDRKANDLRWKIIHRCLPTARRLAGRSPLFTSDMCQVCGKYEENLTHLFFLCDSAKKIWNYISQLIRQRFPSYTVYQVSFKDIICHFPDHDDLRNSPVTGFLRDTGLRHIWQNRNEIVYNKAKTDSLNIFKAKIKLKLKTEFQIAQTTSKMETFEKSWTHHNLLASVCNEVLTLHF